MSHVTRPAALLLVLLLTTQARSQEEQPAGAHDLRAVWKTKKGDRLQVHERVKMQQTIRLLDPKGKALEDIKDTSGYEQRYTSEVEEVDDEGRVVRELRTYKLVKLLDTNKSLELAGVQVVLTLTKDQRTTFAAKKPETKLPPLLRKVLTEETAGTYADAQEQAKLFPPKPVVVGTTWDVPRKTIAHVFSFKKKDIVEEGYQARCRLESARVLQKRVWLTVSLDLKLGLKRLQGSLLPKPGNLTASAVLVHSPDSAGKANDTRFHFEYDGPAPPGLRAPKGSTLKLQLDVESVEKRVEID